MTVLLAQTWPFHRTSCDHLCIVLTIEEQLEGSGELQELKT